MHKFMFWQGIILAGVMELKVKGEKTLMLYVR